MEIAKTINDFIELKNKINGMSSFRKYIGFETENGRRLIIKFKKKDILKDYEYTVLDQNFLSLKIKITILNTIHLLK